MNRNFCFRSREIYLSENLESKKTHRGILLFIFLILVVAVLGFWKIKDNSFREKYEVRILDAVRVWEEGKNLQGINDRRARELVRGAKERVLELEREGVKDKRLASLRGDMSLFLPQILGEYQVSPKLILDLSLVVPGFNLESSDYTGERVFVSDGSKNSFISFSFDGKEVAASRVEDLVKGSRIAVLGNKVFIQDNQRIVQVAGGKAETAVLSEGNWGRTLFVKSFLGNIYVGDAVGEVWRYPGGKSGSFGVGQRWVKEGNQEFFKEAILPAQAGPGNPSFALDSSLWVAAGDKISRFTQGRRDFFEVKELPQSLSGAVGIETKEDLGRIYVLEKGRVVEFGKSGDFVAQYVWDDISEIKAMAVSEEKRKLLLFSNDKVYEIDMAL